MLQTSSSSSDRPVGSRDSDGSSGSLAVCGVGYLDNAAVCNISDIVTVPSTREGPSGNSKSPLCLYGTSTTPCVRCSTKHLDGVARLRHSTLLRICSDPDRLVGSRSSRRIEIVLSDLWWVERSDQSSHALRIAVSVGAGCPAVSAHYSSVY